MAVGSSNGPVRILHVDDDSDLLAVATRLLERQRESFEVTGETSAVDALAHLGDHRCDCIVSDYEMPEMNGLSFLQRVRSQFPELPFILFTGKGSEEIASEAISAGVTDYVQKRPGTDQYAVLANRIDNAVERRAAARKAKRIVEGLESATEGIGLLDADGRYVYLNETYAEMYGYDVADIEGEHWSMLYPPEEVERLEEEVLPAMFDRGSWSGHSVGRRADGSTFTERLSMSLRDDGGHICVVRDVTDQQRRRRELTRYETMVETIDDVVWFADETGRLTFVNRAGRERTPETADIVGHDAASYVLEEVGAPESSVRAFEQALDSVLRGDSDGDRVQVTLPGDDVDRVVEILLAPVVEDGTVTGAVGVNRDVTERVRRENRIERQNERLGTILDNMPVVLFVLDADGTFTLSRGRGLSEAGFDANEVVGESVFDVFADHPSIPDDARRALDGDPVHTVAEVQGHSFETWYQPVVDGGEVDRVVGVATNVTWTPDAVEEPTV